MNRIDISAEEVPLPSWNGAVRRFLRKVLAALGRDSWDLSVLFCGDEYIRSLNARFRHRDEATDVLSFPLGSPLPGGRFLPGDIVISLDTLRENARSFNVTEDEELRRLLVHGVLHLDGMDHAGIGGDEPMLRLQESILAGLAGERILPGKEACPSFFPAGRGLSGEAV
ncbi:MAG: rRNA maturation RNase YbeY [Treponema sp.]|jgi:probable rRNA maturation factor|nr:rRNA maturation RNase YbeY [Treponema sp.]